MESLLKCVWVTLYAFTHYYYGSRGLQTTSDDPGEFGAGKLFIFAFPSHNRNYNPRLLITTWSEQTVYVTITQFSKLPEKKQVDRKNFIDVSFEPLNGNEIEYQNSSIIVQASDYVYVYATAIVAIQESMVPLDRDHHILADGFLAIPAERLGTEYYVASWAPTAWPSTFVVTAQEKATNVLIHFSGGSRGDKHVRLHSYETFYCMDDDYDLTGTLIKSDQPVAVISSHNCACVPNALDDVCNFMEACAPLSEMTLPISSGFGTYFVVSAFPTYSLGFILRVVGSEDSTKVDIRSNLDHHNTTKTIGPGTFTDLKVVSNTSTMVILASKPVLVVQYPICTNITEGSSGSFMVEIPPTDQFSSDVIFPIHNGYDPVQNMVSITSKCDDQADLELNDSPLYLVKGYNLTIDDWCIFHAEISDGLHTVKHFGKNDIRFFVLVYGFLLNDYDGGIAFGYAAARGQPGTVPSSIKPPHTTHRWTTDIVSTTTEHGTTALPTGGIQWLIIEIAIPCAGFAIVVLFILVYLICRYCCSAGGYERMAVIDDDNDDDVSESSSTPGQHDPGPEIGSAGCVSSLPSYKMDSVPRGLCVIINNMNFRDASWQRGGSDKDAGRLIRIFGRFHFKIMIKNDLTAVQMLRSLKQISEINHNPYDAFVCCILTHGQFKAELAGTDMRFIKTQQLLNLFTSDKCPSLAGKPKVFFIQACEGRLLQTTVNSRIVRDNPPASGPAIELIHRSPTHADFLLGYSTVSGCSAYRNTTEGSWYIMALVEALEKHGTEEIMTVLQAVNEIMRMRQPNADIEYESEEFSQIAAPVMSLSKRLYFATLTTDDTSLDTTQDPVVAVNADIPSDLEDES